MSTTQEFEYETLSEYLKALASPNRLELLYQLRFPRTAGEINLTPKRNEAEGNPERNISRQAVERHLSVLEDVGAVRVQRATRDGRPVDEYVVNHANLFGIVEELRRITTIRAFTHVDPLATQGAPGAAAAPPPKPPSVRGPRLVLVAGVADGRAFPVAPANGSGSWLIGRREGADVRLDYDPFVSSENSRVLFEGGRFWVEDIATARNGTTLNYEPVPRGSRALLATGDLVGVGRSLLLFREQ